MKNGRSLGFWETYKKLSHDYFGGSESLVLHIQVGKELDENLLRQAVSFTFDKHPLLQTTIIAGNNSYSFTQNAAFDQIPIVYHQNKSEHFIHDLINEKLNYQFDDNKFLWCFDAVTSNENTHLIVAMHHAISDGISLLVFMLDTLDHYYLLLHDQAYKTPPKARPILPPVEQLLKRNISLQEYLQEREVLSQCEPSKVNYKETAPLQERRTVLAPILTIENEQLVLLKAIAKKNGLTLNSLLAGIWIKTHLLMHNLQTANFTFKTPINLRNECEQKIGLQDIGNYVAIVWQNMHADENDNIITLAKQYQQALKNNLHQATALPKEFSVEKLKETFSIEKYAQQTTFPLVIVMTNPGKVIIPSLLNEYFHISHISGGVNLRFAEPAILLGVCEYQRNLHLCFNYVEPLVNQKTADKFTAVVKKLIDELCKLF